MGTAAQGAATYHFGTSAAVPGVGRGSIDEMSLGSLDKEGNSKAKVKPGSDVRVYGRGKSYCFSSKFLLSLARLNTNEP